MSDVLDSLRIFAEITDDMVDYGLSKAKLESAEKHEIDMFNRRQQAANDDLNIRTNLNILNTERKEIRDDVIKALDDYESSAGNINEIIKLGEAYQTKSGNEIANQNHSINEQTLLVNHKAGQNVGETMANLAEANKLNKAVFSSLNILDGIVANVKNTAKSELLDKGDDIAVKMEHFNNMYNDEEFRNSFLDKLGFSPGEDDPDTPSIDESKIDDRTGQQIKYKYDK